MTLNVTDYLLSKRLVPDFFIRLKIKSLLRERLKSLPLEGSEAWGDYLKHFISNTKTAPIALMTKEANEQHYEVPPAFFEKVLGPHMKYSCAWWKDPRWTLDQLEIAELAMLELCTERAQLGPGMKVLELGCGWGSWLLYNAKKFPESTFLGISNSRDQKKFIDQKIQTFGLSNVQVKTMNMVDADFSYEVSLHGGFDRVISVEMFEHMRNHELLLEKISHWLNAQGKLFVHIFVHASTPYLFEVKDESDWMSRYFFSAGMMPSFHYLYNFQKHLNLEDSWVMSGEHYQKTSEAWLMRMDQAKEDLFPLFKKHYEHLHPELWWQYWRIFFMSCSELWGFNGGREWPIGHYLFSKKMNNKN